jgi:hypothetical protein
MRFDSIQKKYFQAIDGAFSRITAADEAKKRQITLTGHETVLVERHFIPSNIHTGPKKTNPAKATKTFKFYNKNKEIELVLTYPKPAKAELRLYMNEKEGFVPPSGSTWFIYKKKGEKDLYVGWMPSDKWDSISTGKMEDSIPDSEDSG